MNIDLPDGWKPWVEEQARIGGHPTADAYIESLLHQEQRRLRDTVDRALVQSLESGEPVEVTPEFWQAREAALARHLPPGTPH